MIEQLWYYNDYGIYKEDSKIWRCKIARIKVEDIVNKNFIVRNVIKKYEYSAEFEVFWEVFYIEHLIKSTQELIIEKDNLLEY